jgi:CheY-like chemotaxis protein
VEDNPANQQVVMMMLAKMGHGAELAIDGELALARLAAGDFDAVLMDCQIPVLDGYEATRRIRAGAVPGVNVRLPIIALTAYARPEDRAKCLEAGMDDFVTKPVRAADLRAVLERCVVRRNFASATAARENAPSEPPGGVLDEAVWEAMGALPGLEGPSLLPELVRLYVNDEAGRLGGLAQLAEERQAEALAQAAHRFGNGAAALGGMEVRRVALDLERAARVGAWSAVADQLGSLVLACARLRAELKRRGMSGS